MTAPARQTPEDWDGRRDRVVTLRCQGHSAETIAKLTGLSQHRVRKLLESEFQQRFADREEVKRQTAMQLDWLARPLMEKYERDADRGSPDRRDAESILKVIERKCRLLGLDEAVRIDVREVEELSDAELDAELRRHGVVKQLPPAPPQSLPQAVIGLVEEAEIVERPV